MFIKLHSYYLNLYLDPENSQDNNIKNLKVDLLQEFEKAESNEEGNVVLNVVHFGLEAHLVQLIV